MEESPKKWVLIRNSEEGYTLISILITVVLIILAPRLAPEFGVWLGIEPSLTFEVYMITVVAAFPASIWIYRRIREMIREDILGEEDN